LISWRGNKENKWANFAILILKLINNKDSKKELKDHISGEESNLGVDYFVISPALSYLQLNIGP
jgi:hypothetical protein